MISAQDMAAALFLASERSERASISSVQWKFAIYVTGSGKMGHLAQ